LGSAEPAARRVTVGAAAGRLLLNSENAETRFFDGGAIESASWVVRTSAAVFLMP
jgi:hypothetical protein